jgi:hypothetical protein
LRKKLKYQKNNCSSDDAPLPHCARGRTQWCLSATGKAGKWEGMSDEAITQFPRPTLLKKGRKMTELQWMEVKVRAEAGERYGSIAAAYPIGIDSIKKRAISDRWVTPRRLQQGVRGELSQDDPATAAANVWVKRKEEARESSFQSASMALSRFFAMAPVPQSFAEAVLAKKILDQAIHPELGNEAGKGDVNISVLTAVGFTPRVAEE